ncbi:MAG TPA: DUF5985 family protein [Terriglobales bacterium]|jgi:hypothetical protein|nr:DUF5985 family protein [Terriglobales bacterium]
MGPAVYVLGALTTLVCAILLIRGYFRSHAKLLLWSALCFFGLTLSNALIFVDLVLFPNKDLYLWRLLTAAGAMLLLVYGLIWEGEK